MLGGSFAAFMALMRTAAVMLMSYFFDKRRRVPDAAECAPGAYAVLRVASLRQLSAGLRCCATKVRYTFADVERFSSLRSMIEPYFTPSPRRFRDMEALPLLRRHIFRH